MKSIRPMLCARVCVCVMCLCVFAHVVGLPHAWFFCGSALRVPGGNQVDGLPPARNLLRSSFGAADFIILDLIRFRKCLHSNKLSKIRHFLTEVNAYADVFVKIDVFIFFRSESNAELVSC